MPFTPFHFGPAALLKALMPSRFSFFVFCYAQVIMDLQVAYHIIFHKFPLHGWTHTYLGALLIGSFCGITAIPLHSLANRYSEKSFFRPLMLRGLSMRISFLSALIGTLSHIALDSIMHGDMTPWSPFSEENKILRVVSLPYLHLFCVITGVIGVILCVKRSLKVDTKSHL